MKKLNILSIVLGLSLLSAHAEGNVGTESKSSDIHYIKSPRFAQPLLERWIAEYAKVEPETRFAIARGASASGQSDLHIVLSQPTSGDIVYFGQLAVLPVTSRGSEAARLLADKQLSSKKVKELFFVDDELDDAKRKDKTLQQLNVYSGNNATSVATLFAAHYGEQSGSYRGKRIAGDDVFLNTAISKDPLGITVNAIPNLFDLQSRRLKDDLSLVRLALKKEQSEKLSDNATLDEVIRLLEQGKQDDIVVEQVGIAYSGYDENVSRFLQWVLTSGTSYNHDFGLLNLSSQQADAQLGKLKHAYTAQK